MTFGGRVNNIFVIAFKMSTFVPRQRLREILLHYFIVAGKYS